MTTHVVISNPDGPSPVEVRLGELTTEQRRSGQYQKYTLKPGECIRLYVHPHQELHVKELV